jgi:hypothetical protein
MGQLETAGPQIGQMVIYTVTASNFYPALIVSVNTTNGLVRLTTFAPGGGGTDQQNVQYDGSGVTANSWRYPDVGTGL